MFNVTQKYVRIIETRQDGMVGFEFAIGEPELFVELMMPEAAFQQFCATNNVSLLPPKTESQNDWDWSLHQAIHQRFKSPE
jgi:phenol hydroxylase P0 protein